MLVLTKKDLLFWGITCIVMILSIVAPIGLSSSKLEETIGGDIIYRKVIVDAGHGEPDGGAVSKDGIKESDLNLQIAKKLEKALINKNYEVIMTREDSNNISGLNEENTIKSIKSKDLTNRVNLANSSGAEFMISIHMNKYEDPKYYGWQTFYSKNSPSGEALAKAIQEGIGRATGLKNTREALKIEGIKIIDKTTIPSVIVECGFLSNSDECAKLQNDEYQNQIVEGICLGVESYFKSKK